MKLLTIAFALCLSLNFYAQGIKGLIIDDKSLPVPFATIYIESLQSGTTSNINGEFDLKIPSGKYTVLFRALGYKSIYKEIEVFSGLLELKVQMPVESYHIKEIVISAKSEDPAYAIMRKAIALAPFHLREISTYNSKVYLKGTLYVDKMPKLLSKYTRIDTGDEQFQLKTGDVYVEESIYDITFNAPRFYKRIIRSTRSSFPGKNNNPVDPVAIIEASFYEPEIMDLVSPLSPKAFQHYKFKYEGFTQDGENVIDKVRVIPRRESQDLFSGFLYIVEGKWCLYSLELSNTQFWGTMVIKEMFGRVEKIAWLPISYNLKVDAKYLGMRGRFRYSSSVKYLKVQLNEKLKAAINKPVQNDNAASNSKINAKTKEIKEGLQKNNLSNTDMRQVSRKINKVSGELKSDTLKLKEVQIKELTKIEVDSMARKRDTAYWSEFRSAPLTVEELKSFSDGPQSVLQKVKKDSIRLAKDSTKTTSKRNFGWVLMGRQFKISEGKFNINYKGLLQLGEFNFNTVDGFRYGLKSNFWWKLDSGKSIDIQPWVGYAFNRKVFMWEVKTEFIYVPRLENKGVFIILYGKKSQDFNSAVGIHPLINSFYSLFLRENYMKLYQTNFLHVTNQKNFNRIFRLTTTIQYDRIRELDNYSDYSFFFRGSKNFTPNIPPNPNYTSLQGNPYRSFIFSASLRIAPVKRPTSDGYKREVNPFPTFTIKYTTGVPNIFSSESNYHVLGLTIDKRFWLGRNRIFRYQLNTCYWLAQKNVYFSEFSQIRTNELPVVFSSFNNTYQLLPYYSYNTNKYFLGAHVYYQTKLLLLKRLPFISNRIWTENIYANYLQTPNIKSYLELGYGVGQIWALGEVGFFTSIENFKYRSMGLKISIAFE